MSKKLNTTTPSIIWSDTTSLIKKFPAILFPLCIVAFLEALWLELLYFAPRFPLKALFLPPIQRFFGELFLHYPNYLFVLSKCFGIGQLTLYIFIGGILTGVAVVLAASFSQNRSLTFQGAWKKVRGRSLSLILVAFLIAFLLHFVIGRERALFKTAFDFAGKGILYKSLQALWRLTPFINFFIAMAIQVLVIFMIPFLLLENKKLFRAIREGFLFGGRHFLRVYGLLLLPMLLYSPIWFLKGSAGLLISKTGYPETILWVFGVGIVATILVDTFIAVSTTLYFLRVRQPQ